MILYPEFNVKGAVTCSVGVSYDPVYMTDEGWRSSSKLRNGLKTPQIEALIDKKRR
jgi:hypothetical protein